MSATLMEECRKYAQAVHKNTVESTPFFYAKGGTPYTKSTIGKFFRGILWDVGFHIKGSNLGRACMISVIHFAAIISKNGLKLDSQYTAIY